MDNDEIYWYTEAEHLIHPRSKLEGTITGRIPRDPDWQGLPPGSYGMKVDKVILDEALKGLQEMEYVMPSKTRAQLINEIDTAMKMLKQLPDMPEDEYEVGTVMRFEKKYVASANGSWYKFAVIKVDEDNWYITQSSRYPNKSPMTWEELITFIGKYYRNIQVVKEWETIL